MRTHLLLIAAFTTGCVAEIEAPDRAPALPAVVAPAPVAIDPPPPPPAVEPPAPIEPQPPPPPVEPPPPPATSGSLALALPGTSMTLHLNESKSVKLTVTPSSGFNGTATFAVQGLPAGVTAYFAPSSVALTTSPVEVTLTLRAVSELTGTLGMPLTVTTTSGTISGSAPLTLDLLQEVLITIPKGVPLGTAAAPNTTAFGAVTTTILYVNPGTKVTFLNADTRNHEIHAGVNPTGLRHEQGVLVPNGTYSQILNKGTVNFRCHLHPNMLGQIVVK